MSAAFCGCCGNELGVSTDTWCSRCLGHVGAYGPVEERTWFAMTGEDCPHQVERAS